MGQSPSASVTWLPQLSVWIRPDFRILPLSDSWYGMNWFSWRVFQQPLRQLDSKTQSKRSSIKIKNHLVRTFKIFRFLTYSFNYNTVLVVGVSRWSSANCICLLWILHCVKIMMGESESLLTVWMEGERGCLRQPVPLGRATGYN